MGNEKITGDMSIMEMIMSLSEGNPGAMQILIKMSFDPRNLLEMLLFDSLDIRGANIYYLFNDCCGKDEGKFYRTLALLRHGVFTEEQIKKNFSLTYPIPFIDDNVVVEGAPKYGEKFSSFHEKWDEYCKKNKESFEKRLEEQLKNNKKI